MSSDDDNWTEFSRKRQKLGHYSSSSEDEEGRNDFVKGPSRYRGVQFDLSGKSRENNDFSTEKYNENDKNGDKTGGNMRNRSNLMNSFISAGNQMVGDDINPGIKSFDGSVSDKTNSKEPKIDATHMKSYGIGAKLLGKMGYVAGKGLGAEGKGIVEPIEQKLRPTLLGLGGTNERSKGEKTRKQEKSSAASDSEEESFRDARTPRKPKDIYKTMQEMENEGLRIPAGFKHIIDMTKGSEGELVEDLRNVRVSDTPLTDDTLDLYHRAKSEVEQYKKKWEILESRRKYAEFEVVRLRDELSVHQRRTEKTELLESIAIDLNEALREKPEEALESISEFFEKLNAEFEDQSEQLPIRETAIAALNSALPLLLSDWDPLNEPSFLLSQLDRWRNVLGLVDADSQPRRNQLFDNLLYNIWLPKVQSFIIQNWKSHNPSAVILLIEQWSLYLSDLIKTSLIDRSILPALKKSLKEQDIDAQSWINPWLSYLNAWQKGELLNELKHILSEQLRSWSPRQTSSIIKRIRSWKDVIGSQETDKMIGQSLVPRLKEHLRRNFTIDPSNQNTSALNDVLEFDSVIDASFIAEILTEQFFPKLLDVLYQWLVSAEDEDLEELSEWYQTWTEWFPSDIREISAIRKGFEQCLDLMNKALDLENRAELEKPRSRIKAPKSDHVTKPLKISVSVPHKSTFRDLVEEYCLEHDLFLSNLRKSDPISGQTLYKISASPSGAGGITCYFHDNVIFANSKSNRKSFQPIELDQVENLV